MRKPSIFRCGVNVDSYRNRDGIRVITVNGKNSGWILIKGGTLWHIENGYRYAGAFKTIDIALDYMTNRIDSFNIENVTNNTREKK